MNVLNHSHKGVGHRGNEPVTPIVKIIVNIQLLRGIIFLPEASSLAGIALAALLLGCGTSNIDRVNGVRPVSQVSESQQNALDGRYQGTVHIPSLDQSIVIDLRRDKAGQMHGSITLPGMFIKGAAASKVVVGADNKISFEFADVLGGIEIELLAAGSVFDGVFKQSGNAAPVHLEKIGPAQFDLPGEQTLVSSDMVGSWEGDCTTDRPRHIVLALENKDNVGKADFALVGKRKNKVVVDFIRDREGYLLLRSSTFDLTLEGRHRSGSDTCNLMLRYEIYDVPVALHRVKGAK